MSSKQFDELESGARADRRAVREVPNGAVPIPLSLILTAAPAMDDLCHRRDGRIDLWLIDLDDEPWAVQAAADLLSDVELERAARYRFERHRQRFTAAHGAVRAILAAYAAVHPRTLGFSRTDNGKPTLVGRHCGVEFNLTHSDHLALLAVTRETSIGVDIEQLGRLPNADRWASDFLSPAEIAALRRCTGADASRQVLHTWTRKEAIVKAVGDGLSDRLSTIDTYAEANEAPAFKTVRSSHGDVDVTVRSFYGHAYVGAVAVVGHHPAMPLAWRPIARGATFWD